MRTGKGFCTRLGFFRPSDWLEISEESHVCIVAHSHCNSRSFMICWKVIVIPVQKFTITWCSLRLKPLLEVKTTSTVTVSEEL